MPTLLCLPALPTAAESDWNSRFLAEVISLRHAGEPVSLWCAVPIVLSAPMVEVFTPDGLDAAVEDEKIPVFHSIAQPPAWLALDEFDRILLICPEAAMENGNYRMQEWGGFSALPVERRELIRFLFARGGEAVDLVHPEDALDLNQSWCSGRRVGVRLLADAGALG